jgi:hypothetical protein
MMAPKIPTIYGLVAGILKGDVDQGSNWQMVEFTFDNLRRDGVGSNLHFYNALLEALWCLGQRERAARILAEGRRRGVLLEALSHTRMMWAIDVHRFHIILYFIFLFIACTLKSYLMTFLSHLSFASLSWLILLSAAFEDNQLLTNFNAFDGVLVARMSTGAALTTLLVWLADLKTAVSLGEELPPLLSIVTK